MKWSFLLLCLGFCLTIQAQQRLDGSFPFQTDPAKKYSIYVPSTYDATTANKMVLGLHPLNTDRWDAISWCDTLIDFAETNGILLICPDGGLDGAVDDQIDTAFTTVLLDSMLTWYNVDEQRIWAMGFSWGGRTTYSYGLRHADRFAGFLPIGAAINGTSQVDGYLENANAKPFYIIHGANDSPATRFTPILNALNDAEACVESNLLAGVGHTIDFPNRNQILTDAFQWLEATQCNPINPTEELVNIKVPIIYPNPVRRGDVLYLKNWKNTDLYSMSGKLMKRNISESIPTDELMQGLYIIKGEYLGKRVSQRIVIR